MPRDNCDVCCNPIELARNNDSFKAAVLQILCEIDANTAGSGGSGGTSMVDDSTFTPDTTPVTPIAGFTSDTDTAPLTDFVGPDVGAAVRLTSQRGLGVTLYDTVGYPLESSSAIPIHVTVANTTGNRVPTADISDLPEGGQIITGVSMVGAKYDDITPTTWSENDVGHLRMSAKSVLYNTIRDAAGNERGVNVNASNQLSTSVDAMIALPAGSAIIGKVGIDQTTPGTTNLVSLSSETTKVIGTVNQGTSPWVVSGTSTVSGTVTVTQATGTNLHTVLDSGTLTSITNALPVGTNVIGKVSIDQTTPGTTNLVALAANQSVNIAQMNGVTVSMGAGASGTGTQRVVLANDGGKTIISTGGRASSSGNNTLITAGTNRLKVSAFSLSTTSTTAMLCIFQSGASGTELWRVTLQAITGSSTGANLAVPVPSWLFATASATLLNLNLSSANAVDWSATYVDEA